MAEQEDIAAALEKTQNAIHDVELMINSLNDVRLSVHHVFHILQGRSPPLSGAAFRENAKFTYTALESLAKLAINSEGLLNDTQSTELPKLLGPSPISLETKQKEAQQEDKNAIPTKPLPGVVVATFESEKGPEYANLSVEDTLRWFERKVRKSGTKVRASRLETQQSSPFSTLKVNVSGVMNAFIVLEANKKGRCQSISRLVVFGAGEENSVWEDSSHLVFKKISQIAVGAVDYFMDRTPRSLLGLVLEWISMYSTLFTAPCSGCGKHLYFDSQQFKHLPPTLYTYDEQGMALPFHPACQKK
ncbi:mediator complex subunit 27-domain-containing protein [Linnemannia elongata]|nr:mediator complex subunit 27-domain-containing protein [Linnemannia elongata]